jgi:hypothetical protein
MATIYQPLPIVSLPKAKNAVVQTYYGYFSGVVLRCYSATMF